MSKKDKLICDECQKHKDDKKLVRKCLDCGCEYCNHSVPQFGILVTPTCPKCHSKNVTF